MLYSNYEKKVEKIQKILKKIYKFRILIISIIGLILATSVLLMCLKGTFSGDLVVHETTIYYGQSYTYSAKVRMAGIEYEFYDAQTGQWQSAKPYKVGEYKIRAKSNRIFGSTHYSNTVTFSILPLKTDVFINEDSLVYGQKPTHTVQLVAGDKVKDCAYYFSQVCAGEQNVAVESICVVNANNEDVSFCYEFNFQHKQVSIRQKYLKIIFAGAEKVYDGLPLFKEEYSIEGLEYQDEIEIVEFPRLTNAGEIENVAEFKIVNKDGEDVTDNYNIDVVAEKLCVKQREISIKPKDEQKVYDAKPLMPKEYEIVSGDMALGHYITSVIYAGEIVDCEKVNSIIKSLCILNGNEQEVTANYKITVESGELEITPCPIEITAYAKKIYDATSKLDTAEVEIDTTRYDGNKGLFDGHVLEYELVENPTAIDVGKYALEIKDKPTIRSEERDITFNYEITLLVGELEITPCPIEITAYAKKIYDATSKLDTAEVEIDTTRYDGNKGLFDGHVLEYELVENPTAIDVGKYALEIKDKPTIKFEERDITFNYEITLLIGELEIEKRFVKVTTGSDSKEYDRTPLSCDTIILLEGSLVDTHEIIIVSDIPSITEVGSIDNVFDLDVVDTNGQSVKRNYDLNQFFGTLTIEKRKMKLELYDVEKFYDGYTAEIDVRYWTLENKLLEGDSILDIVNYIVTNSSEQPINLNDIISADTYKVNAECIISYAESYVDYYDIEVVGQIIVKKAEITIASNSATKVYDGYSLVEPGYEVIFGNVAPKDSIIVENVGEQIEVGKSVNKIANIYVNEQCIEINGDGIYASDNYRITVKQGTLTVTGH